MDSGRLPSTCERLFGTHAPYTVTILLAVAIAAGCGSAPTAPSVSASPSPVQVSASDRLAWNQSAPSHAALDSYRFGVYVDGERTLLASVACNASPPNVYECTAPLPQMPAGRHTLELVTVAVSGLFSAESARSAPLTIILGNAAESGLER